MSGNGERHGVCHALPNPSALKASGLSVHIFHYDIIYLSQRGTIFQNLPRFVCMKMDFYKFFISYSKQTVPFEIVRKLFTDDIFVQILSFN